MKNDFLVIGAMKSATSTICAYLEDHPEVYMVPNAEPNYFSHPENYMRGENYYAQYFNGYNGETISGEGSNYYSARALFPYTAERIAAFNPQMKIVYMVRNPLKRIVSAWMQNRVDSGDMVPPSIDEAVTKMPDKFIGQSLYWYNLEPFRNLFSDDQIFIGFMEDLREDPDTFLSGLCAFLGVSNAPVRRNFLNQSSGKKIPGRMYSKINGLPLSNAAKAIVPQFFRSAVKTYLLSKNADKMPDFSPDARSKVLEILKPDAQMLLKHCGKPVDFWEY